MGIAANLSNITNTTSPLSAPVSVSTPSWLVAIFTTVIPTVFVRLWELITAPFTFPETQWAIIPLIVTFVLIEFYFFRNVDEELGWSAALANSLVLLFVSIDLTRTVFPGSTPAEVTGLLWQAITTGTNLASFMIIIFIAGLGVALAAINFFHLLPKKIASTLAGHGPVNFVAYVAVVVIYSRVHGNPMPLDGYTVVAGALLFTLAVFIIFMIHRAPGIRSFQRLKGGS